MPPSGRPTDQTATTRPYEVRFVNDTTTSVVIVGCQGCGVGHEVNSGQTWLTAVGGGGTEVTFTQGGALTGCVHFVNGVLSNGSQTPSAIEISHYSPCAETASGLASRAFVPAQTPTPTVAPSLATGSTACGNSLISATTPAGTEPLLDCAGMAYGTSMIRVHVGDQILLSGLEDQTFVTSSPAAILDVHGSLLTARQIGTATIIVHNWFCVPANGTQATSCPLAQVTVT